MTFRAQSLIVVLLLWAAIYLPALGSLPIKGEEGRRILPAISMIESGNYLVPEVGGNAYFSKPPLINWLIAGSFKIFHARNEWAARLPSALCVLAVAIAFVTIARAALSPLGSTFAAMIWLTSAGILEKGRLAEIEALYVSLCGLAIICWLGFWESKRSMWLVWIPASIFLGLGWLAKGPVHLLFFYAVVISFVWQTKNWRALFHPAHFAGILLMLGIFAAWAIPFAHSTSGTLVAAKWTSQFSGRLKGSDFKFSSWIFNIPRGLAYFLPWTIFLPLIRFNNFQTDRERQLVRALVSGAAVPFVLLNLFPGSLPRYAMPALVPACWLLAMTLSQPSLGWPRWLGGKSFSLQTQQRIVGAIAIMIALGVAIYALAIVPKLQQRQNLKGLATQIDEAVLPNESIYALDPNYQPIFFYLRHNLIYANHLEDVPKEAVYLLVRPNREQAVLSSNRWKPRHAHLVLEVTDYRKQSITLFKIE